MSMFFLYIYVGITVFQQVRCVWFEIKEQEMLSSVTLLSISLTGFSIFPRLDVRRKALDYHESYADLRVYDNIIEGGV